MPRKSKRECSYPLCFTLTRDTYCDVHKQERVEQRNDANRFYNMHTRNKERASFYKTGAWEKKRAIILKRDYGLCQVHKKKGQAKTGNIIDHIIPLEVRPDLALEDTNLQTICQGCHNVKTAEDKKKYNI
jgi:5-methylcytosine-specific restriction enzyme A